MVKEREKPTVGVSDRIYFDFKGGKSATSSEGEGWLEGSSEPGQYRPLSRFKWLRVLIGRFLGR